MTAETNYQQKLGIFTIKRAMILFGVLTIGALSLLSYSSFRTIEQIMIGGEAYSNIIDGKDLIADILPPPLYPADAYARVHIIEGDLSRLPDLKVTLLKLKADYVTRMTFWEERMKSSRIIEVDQWTAFHAELKLLNENFWSELEGRFLPAVERGDMAAKDASLAKLTTDFEKMQEVLNKSVSMLGAKLSKSEVEVSGIASDKQWMSVYVSIGIISLLLLMLIAAQRFVVNAITEISSRMARLAGGALETEVPYASRQDEVGQIARALTVFKEQATQNRDNAESNAQIIETLGKALENLASGNLTYRIEQAFPGELDRLRDFFNTTAESLAETITNVKRGTDGIKTGTEEIAQASDDLSRRTENQAANLEETAAAVAEITATVKKTAAGAVHARGVVTAAKDQADRSGEVVRKAVEAMQGIEKSSQKITQIIGVIDEIAFQTNLLALNAGVEAARAGDAGRGFAVVASEVRALAQRSADAAKEIKSLLSTSASQVEQGAQLVAETGMSLKEIIGRVAEINGIVVEIASSAEQQATGLQEVNTAVDQMDQVTQQNAAMVEEATAATRTLTQQSGELARLVSRFTVAANSVIGQALGAARHTPAPRVSVPQYTAAPKRVAAGASTDAGWEEF